MIYTVVQCLKVLLQRITFERHDEVDALKRRNIAVLGRSLLCTLGRPSLLLAVVAQAREHPLDAPSP